MQEDGGMWIAGSMRACSKMSLMWWNQEDERSEITADTVETKSAYHIFEGIARAHMGGEHIKVDLIAEECDVWNEVFWSRERSNGWSLLTRNFTVVQFTTCEHSNKTSDKMKGNKFLDQLSGYQFLKVYTP
jgi:hypothetical protein